MGNSILGRISISDFILAVILSKDGNNTFKESELEDAIIESCRENYEVNNLLSTYTVGAGDVRRTIIEGVLNMLYLKGIINYLRENNKILLTNKSVSAENELKSKYGDDVMKEMAPFAVNIWQYAGSKTVVQDYSARHNL